MDWQLVDHQASAAWAQTTATIDTLDLRKGMRVEGGAWQGSAIGAIPSLLPAKSPASIETYVRGSDLVTTHPASTERPTRVQVYWRRWHELPSSVSAAIEMVVSVQTHLLDSDPTIVLESRLPSGTLSTSDGETIALQIGQHQLHILPHPQDGTDAELIPSGLNGSPVLRHKLFHNRLEKGVILRGRLLFVWSANGLDAGALKACADRFRFSEPMLTA